MHRVETYANVHYGGVGLFSVSREVTWEEWKNYVDVIKIKEFYPGINGLGYTVQVNKKDSLRFLREVQEEIPGFTITGMGLVPEAEHLFIIKYIEPIEENRAALGFDMGSEPTRRAAMERAKSQKVPAISAKVTLVQDKEQTPGFLMYVPVYTDPEDPDQKVEKFKGWVYAPFIAKYFMGDIFKDELSEVRRRIKIELFDGAETGEEDILYSDGSKDTPEDALQLHETLALHGHQWTIRATTTSYFYKMNSPRFPFFTLITGLALSLLLFGLSLSVTRTRSQAVTIADRMTQELRALNAELDHKVKERTKELEEKNRELKDFSHIVSHDLKAPLRSISTLADWTLTDHKSSLKKEAVDNLEMIKESAKKMHEMIMGLLSYAKMEKSLEDKKTVSLQEVVNSITRTLMVPPHLKIKADNLPDVCFEPLALYQIMQNLISNSIKYNDKDKGIIEVDAQEKNNFYQVNVRDNGKGIKPEDSDKVFRIFSLAGSQSSESTGVGLSIVKKLVEAAGGNIWFNSEPGQGTTFSFTIPKEAC